MAHSHWADRWGALHMLVGCGVIGLPGAWVWHEPSERRQAIEPPMDVVTSGLTCCKERSWKGHALNDGRYWSRQRQSAAIKKQGDQDVQSMLALKSRLSAGNALSDHASVSVPDPPALRGEARAPCHDTWRLAHLFSPGLQVCRREGQDSLVFSVLLRHMRGMPEGAPQQTLLLQEASRQAAGLPAPFAIPALLSALQVGPSACWGCGLEELQWPVECWPCD